jgi:transcriptional regulator with XRE-family HTH domain
MIVNTNMAGQGPKHLAEPEVVPNLDVCVARRIVRLREEKNLTQSRLARLCGISAAYLSRVESSQASLTLSGLAKVASALEIPATALLDEEASAAPLSLHRSHDKMKLLRGRGSHADQVLAGDKKGKLMEPLLVEVSRTPSAGRQYSHAGEEFDYLIEGSCTFFYGKERFKMEPGDAVYFDASIPHGIVKTAKGRARLLVMVSARDYLFHGDIRRLLGTDKMQRG